MLHVIVRSAALIILVAVVVVRLAAMLHVSLFGAPLPRRSLVTIAATLIVTLLVLAWMFLAMRHRSRTGQ